MPQWKWTLILYGLFLCGQLLYVIKRADFAARSPLNPTGSRSEFISRNGWLIFIRAVIEIPFVFYPIRHIDPSTWLSAMGISLPFEVKMGFLTSFASGFLADSLLDWIFTRPSIPAFLKEAIPLANYNARALSPCQKLEECHFAVRTAPAQSGEK